MLREAAAAEGQGTGHLLISRGSCHNQPRSTTLFEPVCGRGIGPWPRSGAAAHPANQVIEGNSILVPKFPELIDVNRIGQNPRRFLS